MMASTNLFVIVFGVIFLSTSVHGQACSADGTTCDAHEPCAVWKEQGKCLSNKGYMDKYCPVSCSGVPPVVMDSQKDKQTTEETNDSDCEDAYEQCGVWAQLGECDANPHEMSKYCGKSCGTCSQAENVQDLCRDTEDLCSFWASVGECSEHADYMMRACPRSCGSCIPVPKPMAAPDGALDEDESQLFLLAGEDSISEAIEATRGFGIRQEVDGDEQDETLKIIFQSIEYMASEEVRSLSGAAKDGCRNTEALCSFWARRGECRTNEVRFYPQLIFC